MKKNYALIVIAVLLCFALTACGPSPDQLTATAMVAQAQTETGAPTKTPTLTSTPTATPTRTPTPTPRPTSTPSCDLDAILRAVKAAIPYEEYVVQFNNIGGTASLLIWYVDPELEPYPSAEKLQEELKGAIYRAALLSTQVKEVSSCTKKLFDVINPVVVDKKYQGWFSGQLRPTDLIGGPEYTEEEISYAADAFQVGYLRTALKHPYQEGSCDWPEAKERLQSHFAADRELVSFYFVIDDIGSNVWVQWDGPADPIFGVVSLGNVFLGLECFSPNANVIYIIVDENGIAQQIGIVPQGDTSRLTIVYP